MATLTGLPNEIIAMICNELHPFDPCGKTRAGLPALAALARTNRRLQSAVDPLLYGRGVHCHKHLPLAWAAKRGLSETLKKSLAVGASPNHTFQVRIDRQVWNLGNKVQQAAADWSNHDPKFWPPDAEDQLACRNRYARVREVTPTLTGFDVFAPTQPEDDPDEFDDSDSDSIDPDAVSIWSPTRSHTALHIAAKEGHGHIVDMLLNHGAKIDASSELFCHCEEAPVSLWQSMLMITASSEPGFWSPLHVAICLSRIETAKLLVSRGAPIIHPGGSSDAPLYQAASLGHVDLLKHMLDKHRDLDINVADDSGLTSLYYAYANRRWDTTVPLLLSRGANIDSAVRIRWPHSDVQTTPLGEACYLGRYEDALKLLDLGADMTLGVQVTREVAPATRTRIPLLHLCCMDFAHGSWPSPPPEAVQVTEMQAVSRPRILSRLITDGLSPDMKWDASNGRDHTPLSVAAQHINIVAVKAMLDAGANVHVRNSQGRSVLMMAVAEPDGPPWQEDSMGFVPAKDWTRAFRNDYPNRWMVVKLLVDAGIQVNDTDADGNTVLHLLFAGHHDESPWMEPRTSAQILRLLIAGGADPRIRNNAGELALQIAVRNKCVYALDIIARQCRIDLVDQFTTNEIIALFREARPDGQTFGRLDIRARRNAMSIEQKLRYLVAILLDMDPSRRLAANPDFLEACLSDTQLGPALFDQMADYLCLGDLEKTSAKPDAMLRMLRWAITAKSWDTARLLLEISTNFDINAIDPYGQSLLSTAITSGAKEDVVLPLIDAGADVHGILPSSPEDTAVKTPLKLAIMQPLKPTPMKPKGNIVECMLKRQPIQGSPQAALPLYLHAAVATALGHAPHADSALVIDHAGLNWDYSQINVRIILAAGADPRQVDDDGNTPLSLLLSKLVVQKPLVPATCHWIKPLSRGVDINRKNKYDMSVADYIQRLTAGQDPWVSMIQSSLQLVTLENGDREIKWLK